MTFLPKVTALLFSSVVISSQALADNDAAPAARPATDTHQVFLTSSLHSSSLPVPVYEMAKGWGDTVRSGDYAYADARLNFGFNSHSWSLSVEQRWYYNLNFNNDTAQFYSNVENKIKTNRLYDLDLQVTGLEAEGLRLSKLFQLGNLRVVPSLAGYRVNHYQLGTLSGRANDLSGLSVSALIDYYYDDDKILDHQASPDSAYGLSLDLGFEYQLDDWQLALNLGDLLNRWQFNDSPFTRGCVNLKGDAMASCGSTAVGSGLSGREQHTLAIPVTLAAQVAYQPQRLTAAFYHHDRYQRFSLQKDWDSQYGLLGVSAHTTGQLGIHWQSRWHQLRVLSDHWDWKQAHHLQLELGFKFPFR